MIKVRVSCDLVYECALLLLGLDEVLDGFLREEWRMALGSPAQVTLSYLPSISLLSLKCSCHLLMNHASVACKGVGYLTLE